MLKKVLFLCFLGAVFCSAAADFAQKSSWLIADTNKKAAFDLFYLLPELPEKGEQNASLRSRLKTFAQMQTGIIAENARVFAPGILTGRKKSAEETGKAFRHYLKHWNKGRPYVLFGHAEGAVSLYELLKNTPEISPEKGFAAAYLPGLHITENQLRKDLGSRGITPAADEGSTGTVIIWNTRTAPAASDALCGINPMNWRKDGLKAEKKLHKGMLLFDNRVLAPLLYMYRDAKPLSCTAALDKKGELIVSDLPSIAAKLFADEKNGSCRTGDVWLFVGNIAENIRLRTTLYTMKKEFDKAVEMIKSGNAECVLLRDGKIAAAEKGRGVSPLLRLYDRDKAAMKNAVIVDKVIGRAAAAIAINGGAKHVFGLIMSEDAQSFLKDNGISASWELGVARILNRKRDGLCPLEQSVEGIADPVKALAALREKIALLMGGSNKK